VPQRAYERIVLGHGSGGRLSHDLLFGVILEELAGQPIQYLQDQATVEFAGGTMAMTTDAFVVRPLCFAGGNIGDLAINGTVNDLAMGGARPLYISVALILEEGLEVATLRKVLKSMGQAAANAGVSVVTGDTKVVERGSADGMYVATTGVGVLPPGRRLGAQLARPGDRVLVSGTLGDHGIAVLTQREGIRLQTDLTSDTAALNDLVDTLVAAAPETHTLRDPTRGGVSSALNEIAQASGVRIVLDETSLPINDAVRGACELLGFDPLYVANEGKLVAIVPAAQAGAAEQALRGHPLGQNAVEIGEVREGPPGVSIRSMVGGERNVPMLAGEQLPRIC
jgi:hydrogenase expression/formation protein HypE